MNFYNQNTYPPELIGNFRFMQPQALAAIKNMYSLNMGIEELEFCRYHYEKIEKRDPNIYELRLLDDLITRNERAPDAIRISDIKSESLEIGRTYEDLISKLGTLEKFSPYSYSDIASAADLYIKRVGKKTSTPSLYGKCTANGNLEFAAKGAKELLRLEFPEIDSVCSVGVAQYPPFSREPATESDAFVLISSLGCDFEGDFPETLSKILFVPRIRKGIKRAATVEKGGVLPFLLSSAKGFYADISGFPGYNPDVGELRLLTREIKNTVVLLCKKEALTAIINHTEEANLRFLFFGHPIRTPNSSVRYSRIFPFMINADFLRSLSFKTNCSSIISRKKDCGPCEIAVKKALTDDGIVALAAKPHNPSFESAIFSTARAVSEIAASGVDFTDISVSFDARLPLLNFDNNRLGDALEVLLGQYRVQAELCLLSEGSRYTATENELSFALYARAKSAKPLPDTAVRDSGALCIIAPKTNENGLFDFDELRRILLLIARSVREGKITAVRVCSGDELENEIKKMVGNADILFEAKPFGSSPVVFIAESDKIEGASLVEFTKIRPDFEIL